MAPAAPSGQSNDGAPSASCSLSPDGAGGKGVGDMALLGPAPARSGRTGRVAQVPKELVGPKPVIQPARSP